MIVIGVIVMMIIVITMVMILRITPPLPQILIVCCIHIQGIRGYVFPAGG